MTVKKRDRIISKAPSPHQQKYLIITLRKLRETRPIIYLPAVGQFTLVGAALAAGYEHKNIHTSDVSLYSGLMGALFDPGAEEPKYQLSNEWAAKWEFVAAELGSEQVTRTAFVMYVMKVSEYIDNEYNEGLTADLLANPVKHTRTLVERLKEQVAAYGGIRYRHQPLPSVVYGTDDERAVVVVAPPIYTGRAVKGFKYGEHILYEPSVEKYSWRKEFPRLYEASRDMGPAYLWINPGQVDTVPSDDLIFAKETRADRIEYTASSTMHLIEGVEKKISSYKRPVYAPYPAPMWQLDDELKPDSKVEFVKSDRETILYYRDLWAHKLGATDGEGFVLMLIDGKVYSAVIMEWSNFTHMKTNYIFEQSGFSAPSTRHPHLHRLLMWCLTTQQFGTEVIHLRFKRNRIFDAIGLETTCLSKYRKLKSNNGIFEVKFRERLANGMYRILYQADFRQEGYAECVTRVLQEEEHGRG